MGFIDGIELDFIRHPLFFQPNLEGKPAEPRHVAMMTDMVRRIRAVTERESMRRGRPILVTIPAPLSVKSCMDIGIDTDPEAIPDPHRIAELLETELATYERISSTARSGSRSSP